MILEWVRKHNRFGDEGLLKQPNTRATGKFKEETVRLIIEKNISLPEVVLLYGVSISALEAWLKAVRIDGYQVLHIQNKRGRPVKSMGRVKKQEPKTELEKLQVENARLRAEVTIQPK